MNLKRDMMNLVLKLLRETLKSKKHMISHSKEVLKIEDQDIFITNLHKKFIKNYLKFINQILKAIELLKEEETNEKKALNIDGFSNQRELLDWMSNENEFNIQKNEIDEILKDFKFYKYNCC